MALSPDTTTSFAREVDENLRRDQARDFAKRYGKWIAGGLILFLALVGGYLFWQDRERKQAEASTETLIAILQDVDGPKAASVPARLDALRGDDAEGVRTSAGFARAALALQQGDRKLASAIYASLAADKDLASPYRDLATLRGVMADYDSLKPDEVIARLQPLAVPGGPFHGGAGEMVGMALIAKGQRDAAAKLFAAIAADKGVPDSLRSRAVQVAGSLGLDASASLPTGPSTEQ